MNPSSTLRRLAPILALVAIVCAAPAPARATTPVTSPHGSLKAECSLCHGAKGWAPAEISKEFDHAAYGFGLEGAHRSAACTACHRSLEFAQAETACASCHLDPHRGELGVACEQCHTPRSFLDRAAMTRRHQETRFPLMGAHLAADCRHCHEPQQAGGLQFVALPSLCQSCHLSEYQAAKSPDHAGGGFSLQCESCHRPFRWDTASFDHAASGFPLTGAHRTTACTSCHVGGVYAGTSTDCFSCHQDAYAAAANPNHALAGYSTLCEQCHQTSAWTPAAFNHNTTNFPLTGAHLGAACVSCHVGDVYAGTGTACVSCHQSDYDATTSPIHSAAAFPVTCASCHTTSNWNSNFLEHDSLYFPIYSGAHRGRWSDCAECHTQPSSFASFSCIGCHPHSDQQNTDGHHASVSSYQYLSAACYACHPQGRT